MRAFAVLLLAASLTAAPGCATVASLLPGVIAAVTDGMMVLDTLELFIKRYFDSRPTAPGRDKLEMFAARARSALNAALRAAHGAEKLDQAQIDAAFAEFRVAYTELLALLEPLGVKTSPDIDRPLAAGPNTLFVPEPLAFKVGAARGSRPRPAAPAAEGR